VKTLKNLRVPQKSGNFLTKSVTVSFPKRTLYYAISLLNKTVREGRTRTYVNLESSLELTDTSNNAPWWIRIHCFLALCLNR
jgi:hypothetical protein